MNKWLCLMLLAFALPLSAMAQEMRAEQPLPDSAQEQRARELFRELRCEVCAGQSISDSNAALAQDMRQLVRRHVAEGRGDAEILEYFSSRYGDSILMRPPVNASTAPLWLAPLFIFVLGGWFIIRYFARKRHSHF
jgi:cytochrome c-type biogenesis protein CcmH